MIANLQTASDSVFNGFHRDSDFVLPFLLRNKVSCHCKLFISLQLSFLRIKTQHISIFFRNFNAVCHFGLRKISQAILFLGTYSSKGGSKEQSTLIL